ncbi:hypothetical protein IBE11_00650 [Francisella tularensis subsp. novicida]|uniref:hypothetical protein n=1 Tax=Francisella tularensis TaxID=263 RepID=UPI000158ACD6|nr:hypothetical protein [Francisella tularensis]AJI46249.1 hypothetical protein AS84_85 [Francisella tularensis subsp. novicida F6168]AJJ47560.1 hypothetical protein CH70_1466 [Francisella tularensis subsp. novicida]APC95103.1 hypothetical protein KX02_1214 [Francisella tularensis subsp. novicida]APC98530.1 hypothetical protein KX03_601 [Francisella tularensis subsp. novicida]EDN35937.1 conserved hypothetical protein [Francisella tularensis subsp. novicida GA99-3549]
MFKKTFSLFIVCVLLLNINLAYSSSSENKITDIKMHSDSVPKVCNQISTTLMTPITAVGIAVGTVLIIPVGLIGGMAGGAIMSPMMFDSGGLSKNPIIQPIQITGAALLGIILGAGVGSIELPVQTASSLTKSAQNNCYML